jgi:hypothetical protein
MRASSFRIVALSALAALFVSSAAAIDPPARLGLVEPFRLEMQPAGSPRQITISGDNFENVGHPSRDQYMHWQIRRDDGGWQRCTQASLREGSGICHGVGWTTNQQTIEIGGSYTTREGFVELRVFHGLAPDDAVDPASASPPSEWSNIVRVPVVVPGPAPTIRSLSRSSFTTGGTPSDYQFIIDAGGVTGTPAVVFRGDVVVFPERVYDGHNIQVTVPEVYRLSTPGELEVQVRTDRGGLSPEVYIRFVAPPQLTVSSGAMRRAAGSPAASGAPSTTTTPSAPSGSAATATANTSSGPPVAHLPGGVCIVGFVWREVTPSDHVCVTSDMRARTARQNQEASTHRLPNAPDTCVQGFVWREAIAGDHVCVTPDERSQAAEDNRQASSRIAS